MYPQVLVPFIFRSHQGHLWSPVAIIFKNRQPDDTLGALGPPGRVPKPLEGCHHTLPGQPTRTHHGRPARHPSSCPRFNEPSNTEMKQNVEHVIQLRYRFKNGTQLDPMTVISVNSSLSENNIQARKTSGSHTPDTS